MRAASKRTAGEHPAPLQAGSGQALILLGGGPGNRPRVVKSPPLLPTLLLLQDTGLLQDAGLLQDGGLRNQPELSPQLEPLPHSTGNLFTSGQLRGIKHFYPKHPTDKEGPRPC